MRAELPEIPERRFEDYNGVSFSEFREKLDDLLEAVFNLIDRDWPSKYAHNIDLKVILLGTVKITENTYRSIRYLCADRPKSVARKLEFAVSVPPLARTILDSVFNVVYLFDDLDHRLEWYHKSGWREAYEEYLRYRDRYGHDPAWKEYLGWQKAFADYAREQWDITDDEVSNVKSIQWWPNPGKMARDPHVSQDRRCYLRYLNDWFYKTLSADSHLSWPGFARRSGHFLNNDEEKRLNLLRKYKSDCVTGTISLVLSLLSEIECEFKFGRAQRLKEVWATLGEVVLETKELYEFRYAGRL